MLSVPAAAVAKGPTDVAVEGPGVDRQLTYTRRAGDVDIGMLGQAARIYELWTGRGLAAEPPMTPDELGPEFVLTWTVGGAEWLVQHAYPFAEGGAWVRQPSGWARTPALTEALVELGAVVEPARQVVPVRPVVPAVEPAAAPAAAEDSRPTGRTPYDVIVPAGLALVVVLAAAVLIARRRSLSR